MPSEPEVLGRIKTLVDEEHGLRSRREREELTAEEERRRLQEVEVELDRCWDLLRQRRALLDSGRDPDAAGPRPGDEVEGYLG